MNNTNTLISSDNKGYAAYALEQYMNGPDALPGKGPYVSAFASTNLTQDDIQSLDYIFLHVNRDFIKLVVDNDFYKIKKML